LVRGTNNTVFQFGREIARRCDKEHLTATIDAYRVHPGPRSALFLSGYLATVFAASQGEWERVVTQLLGDDAFNDVICAVIRNSGTTDAVVQKMLSCYDSGRLGIGCLRSFAFCNCLKSLNEDTFLEFFRRVLSANETAFALELLDFVYCQDGDRRTLPEDTTWEVLNAAEVDRPCGQADDYHWSVVASQFVAQFPPRVTDLFHAALDKVVKGGWFHFSHHHAYGVVRSLIQSDPVRCWGIIAARLDAASRSDAHCILNWLSPHDGSGGGLLTLFPLDAVFDWVAADSERRARALATIVPKSLACSEDGNWTRELLIRHGGETGVMERLSSHFWSGGYVGNASEHYRSEREKARSWLSSEKSSRVRQWLEFHIRRLSNDIESAEIDEERRL
jgi:hypothetical protein